MRQGITTRYLGPTNSKGSRYKALARKADQRGKEMSLTDHADYAANYPDNHTRVAKLLATKLGWSGLWVGGGKPEDDGYLYVNVGERLRQVIDQDAYEFTVSDIGKEDVDWFYVEPQEPA